ncbi:MAG: EAL domain-containing protein [Abitibacteriaceae bacterium]|nr:EAL domain-containing protein [Abditibacteriaceae bacterium]
MKSSVWSRASFAALWLVFSLPFIIIFSLLLKEINANISETEQGISGLEYEKPLMKLLQDVLQYRNLANASLATPAVLKPRLAQQQIVIDNDIKEIDRVEQRLGATLHTTEKWHQLKAVWEKIQSQSNNLKPDDIKSLFDPHNGQITVFLYDAVPNAVSLNSLIGDVADNSGLVLESHLDTYYLINAGIIQLPSLAMETANISDVGQLVLARGSQSITNEEIQELNLRSGLIKSSQYAVGHRIKVAVGYNPTLQHELNNLDQVDKQTVALLHLVDNRFIGAYYINIPSQQYYQACQSTLTAQFGLCDPICHDANTLMATELRSWQSKQRFVATFAILVMLIAVSAFVMFYRSLEGRLQAEASLRESEKLYRLIVDNALDAVVGMDQSGHVIEWSPQAEAIFGWSQDEAVGQVLATMIIPFRYREAHEQGLKRFLETGQGRVLNQGLELAALHRDGHEFPVDLKISLVEHKGQYLFSAFISDITERKKSEEQLQQSALFDALTGLPNRTLFMDRLGLMVKRAKRHPEVGFAVLFIDLDNFKVVNDSMGHTVGDQLLIAVARRLEPCLRPGDTVARLGGDEFTILLEDSGDLTAATHVAERIQNTLAAPFTLNDRPLFISASIGIAGGELHLTDQDVPTDYLEALLRDADTAMYRAKAQGRASYAVFDNAMHEQAVARLHLEADLRQALEREEFEAHYQPIMQLDNNRVIGFEALVRWQHPERGLISPAVFIPVAEETGLIMQVDRWVLRAACQRLAAWQQEFPAEPPLTVSVNLSGRHFGHPDLIKDIKRVLQETQLNPATLKLEITESAIIDNPQSAASVLQQLQALGVQLSIDDFGTGYSSLSYLHRLPFNTLKIDRSFVREMSNSDAGEIVRTIIALAHNLNLDVVAEGIETPEQVAQLKILDCEYGQGFLFSKPLNIQAAQSLLAVANLLSN